MIDERARAIILQEIQAWHREELISDDQRDQLTRRYESMPATPEAVALRAERQFSAGMMAMLSVGGGLVFLGLCFLVGKHWEDMHSVVRFAVVAVSTTILYAAGIYLRRATPYGKTAEGLCLVGAALLWLTGVTAVGLFLTDEHSGYIDYIVEHHGEVLFPVLSAAYLAGALALRSQGQGWYFAIAVVWAATAIAENWSMHEDWAMVLFFTSVGAVLICVGYACARMRLSFLVPPLGIGGMLLAFIAMMTGTWMDEIEVYSYVVVILIPLAVVAYGAYQGKVGLVRLGLAFMLASVLRIFAEFIDDLELIIILSILLGIAFIVGAVLWERRRLKRA